MQLWQNLELGPGTYYINVCVSWTIIEEVHVYNDRVYIAIMSACIGRGSQIGRARASRVADLESKYWSSQTNQGLIKFILVASLPGTRH